MPRFGSVVTTFMVVIMLVMVMMTVLMVVLMAVVFAAFRRRGQLAVQISGCQLFHRRVWKSGANLDAFLGEDGQRTLANATHNNNVRALLAQPAREKSRRVRRRCHWPDADNCSVLGVRLHEREFPAAAKVSVKPAFG